MVKSVNFVVITMHLMTLLHFMFLLNSSDFFFFSRFFLSFGACFYSKYNSPHITFSSHWNLNNFFFVLVWSQKQHILVSFIIIQFVCKSSRNRRYDRLTSPIKRKTAVAMMTTVAATTATASTVLAAKLIVRQKKSKKNTLTHWRTHIQRTTSSK